MQAALVSEAGLDGLAWLRCTDRVESVVTVALAETIHQARADAAKAARQG
jgi:hypothetical protein